MQPQHLVAGGVALLIAIGSGVWFGGKPVESEPMTILRQSAVTTAPPDEMIVVHVSGAVAEPGLVVLSVDARVADALAGAGGALPAAELSAVNLAAPVSDGSLIVVAQQGQISVVPEQRGDGRVNLNRAAVDEIVSLPGIGPVLAERIIEFRETNGPFGVVEDLLDVPGIGEAKLATLRDAVVVP